VTPTTLFLSLRHTKTHTQSLSDLVASFTNSTPLFFVSWKTVSSTTTITHSLLSHHHLINPTSDSSKGLILVAVVVFFLCYTTGVDPSPEQVPEPAHVSLAA